MTTETKKDIEAWGLSVEAINELPEQLIEFHERYRRYLRTRTRDTSEYGLHYISNLMRMGTKRNMANIGRTSKIAEQNMQQFISDSPWRADHLIKAVQSDLIRNKQFASGNVLIIDESADEKSGEMSAGAGRQHNGRLGKIDCCQVGVFLGLTNNGYHTWIDGELFIPEAWFAENQREKRKRIGIPEGRVFATKLEFALQMLERLQDSELIPFEAVDVDALYGRKGWFREQAAKLGIEYYADIPANTHLYLEKPLVCFPKTKQGKRAKHPVISGIFTTPSQLKEKPTTDWHHFVLRPCERGMLEADFARIRVWTVDPDGSKRQEWLLIRQDPGDITYSLSNAPVQTPLLTMAERKSQRFAIEHSNQNMKSELGWASFKPSNSALGLITLHFRFLRVGSLLKPSLFGVKSCNVTLYSYNFMKLMSCQPFPLPMFALYCIRLCHFPSFRHKKRRNWWSNILIIVLVLANPGSTPPGVLDFLSDFASLLFIRSNLTLSK